MERATVASGDCRGTSGPSGIVDRKRWPPSDGPAPGLDERRLGCRRAEGSGRPLDALLDGSERDRHVWAIAAPSIADIRSRRPGEDCRYSGMPLPAFGRMRPGVRWAPLDRNDSVVKRCGAADLGGRTYSSSPFPDLLTRRAIGPPQPSRRTVAAHPCPLASAAITRTARRACGCSSWVCSARPDGGGAHRSEGWHTGQGLEAGHGAGNGIFRSQGSV